MVTRVLLSTTDDPWYSQGAEYVCRAWLNMGLKVTLTKISPIEGIPLQNLGKLMRVLSSFNYPDDYCLISDVDVTESNIVFYTSELEGVY